MKQQNLSQQPQQEQKEPILFFDLMQIVGAKGNYQTICLILWCVIWFIDGSILISTPFLFYMQSYKNCQNDIPDCDKYVCSLAYQGRSKYLVDQNHLQHTLSNQFGDYHCQRSFQIELSISAVYFGSFVGYFMFSMIIDNLGRKATIIMSLSIASIGISLLSASNSLRMAQIGLFLTGVGLDSSTSASFNFITQTVQNSLRQKYSIIVQGLFCLGGFGCTLYYYVFSNWRIIIILFYMIPLIITAIIIFWFVQETPQFLLIHNSTQKCIQSLQKVRAVNGSDQKNFNRLITFESIKRIQEQYKEKQILSNKRTFTPLDLITKHSLRIISLSSWVLGFNTFFMYYAPIMLLKQYDLDIFLVSLSLLIANSIVYPISYFYIQKMQRRKWIGIFLVVATLCSIALTFMHHSQNQVLLKLQLIFIFVHRFCISFEFTIFILQINELFPAQVRGLGVGISLSFGTIGSSLSPIIIGQLQKSKFPVMTVLILLGLTSIVCQYLMTQTLNVHLKEQIDQFNITNDDKNQKVFLELPDEQN